MNRAELREKTKPELLAIARRMDLPGRNQMTKEELVVAIARRSQRATAARGRKTAAMGPIRKPRPGPKPKSKPEPEPRPQPTRAPKPKRKAPPREKQPAKAEPLQTPAPPTTPDPGARAMRGAPLGVPERYGKDYVGLMVRDPYWLHAYWEVTPGALQAAQRALRGEWQDRRLVLRVYAYGAGADAGEADAGEERHHQDIELPEDASSWYINVGEPGQTYAVAVGLLTSSGRFHSLAESNLVTTPRGGCSPVTDEEWTHRAEIFARLAEMLEGGLVPGSSAALGMPPYERPAPDAARRGRARRKTDRAKGRPAGRRKGGRKRGPKTGRQGRR